MASFIFVSPMSHHVQIQSANEESTTWCISLHWPTSDSRSTFRTAVCRTNIRGGMHSFGTRWAPVWTITSALYVSATQGRKSSHFPRTQPQWPTVSIRKTNIQPAKKGDRLPAVYSPWPNTGEEQQTCSDCPRTVYKLMTRTAVRHSET